MTKIKLKCGECDSECEVRYDVDKCEDDPHYCCFCGELIVEADVEDDDE